MKRSILALISTLLVILSPSLNAQSAGESKIEEILKKMDELYRSTSSRALIEMQIATPHWERTLKMEAWSIGMDKTFIRILEPKKENGIATLRIRNEMWNYLPRTNKVIKIPPSMMMSSWMGSDFTNDDLVKEFTFLESYNFSMTNVDDPEEGLLYIECIPKEDLPIVWGSIIIAVRDGDYLPVWEEFYDEKGNLMRAMIFRDIKDIGGKIIPAVMELIPKSKEGHKTVVRYIEADFDIEIDEEIFTLRNLRKGG